jgi:hypothetical protein
VSGRTFIVRVSDAPRRVVVEDVRAQRSIVVTELAAVGSCIARLLDDAPDATMAPQAPQEKTPTGP